LNLVVLLAVHLAVHLAALLVVLRHLDLQLCSILELACMKQPFQQVLAALLK
jgi:hypothetical protein